MGMIRAIRDSLASRGGAKAAGQYPGWLRASAEVERHHTVNTQMPAAQAELYQRLAAVSVAVDVVANLGTTSKLNVKRVQADKLVDVPNHDFERLLQRPNPRDSRSELMKATLAWYSLTGTAYWFLNRTSEFEPPSELWPVPTSQLVPVPNGRSYLDGYDYDPGDGKPLRYPVWNFCQFKRFNPKNSFVGMSLVEALAVDAEAEMDMAKWNRNYFGKDNAKVPGALAFADFVPDATWETIKNDINEGWGGTNRKGPMKIRGAGAGGVEWVAMALSQKEMDFLSGRQFIKEEIWSGFAPGLASMLAINANEANSRTGKAILIEMGVWPMLTGIAEKVTQAILPAYGSDLIADFDDIRITDKAMELQERQSFAITHTVDEIRQEFYEHKPLGDERGQLLPAQIGPNTPLPGGDDLGPKQPAPVVVQQPGQPNGENTGRQVGQDNAARNAENTGQDQQAKADLEKWQAKAVNRVKRGKPAACEFESDTIEPSLAGAIAGALEAAKTTADVRGVFADVWQGYP